MYFYQDLTVEGTAKMKYVVLKTCPLALKMAVLLKVNVNILISEDFLIVEVKKATK